MICDGTDLGKERRMKPILLALAVVLIGCHRDAGMPLILFDQAHHNHHRLRGTYKPFAKVMREEGFAVEALKDPIDADALRGARVLAVISALGDNDQNDEPAFTPAECDTIEQWVRGGGSLLLVVDHWPFGPAVAPLAARFGVAFHGGMTFDPQHSLPNDDSALVFSRQNGLLAEHAITRGVGQVVTFTGTSVRGGTPILFLAGSAVQRTATPKVTKDRGDTRVEVTFGDPQPAAGWSQGAVLTHGRGRVAVLGEAAMLTAQEDGRRLIGMNYPGCDNKQFAVNLMHWLMHNGNP